MKTFVGTIDCTPKWADVVMDCATRAAEGNADARKELLRMAQLADTAKETREILNDVINHCVEFLDFGKNGKEAELLKRATTVPDALRKGRK